MAVLEKIRKKSVLLFIIIIGALLAFILGDFINSGRSFFGPGDTVAKVNGVKVDQQSFQTKSKEVSELLKETGVNYDDDALGTLALNEALLEQLLESEFSKMGIKVSDDMIGKIMLDPDFAPMVFEFLGYSQNQLQQLGIVDQKTFIESFDAKTRSRYPNVTPEIAEQFHQRWLNAEKNVEQSLKNSVYNQILGGLFQPNDADALVFYANTNNRATVRSISVPFSNIADDEVKLADADYEAYYKEHKGMFKILDETRGIAYIIQDVTPSAADRAAAVAKVKEATTALRTTPGMDGANKYSGQGFHKLDDYVFSDKSLHAHPLLQQMPDSSLTVGYVQELVNPNDENSFVVAKVLSVSEGIDNVTYTMVPEQLIAYVDSMVPGDVKDPMAVVSLMNNIAALNGGKATTELSLLNRTDLQEYYANALKTAPVNEYVIINDSIEEQPVKFGLVVQARDEVAPAYKIGAISYQLVPSSETHRDAASKLNAFVAKNANADSFISNAEKEGYTVRFSTIDANSFSIDPGSTSVDINRSSLFKVPTLGMSIAPRTKSLVKWAMEADKGAVSPALLINSAGTRPYDYLIAVAVEDIFDDDYIPVSSTFVKKSIEPDVRKIKKGQMLVEQYKGAASDINGYATAMGLTDANISTASVLFGAHLLGGEAQGAVAGAAEGTLVGPVAGTNGVYVFQVDANVMADPKEADLKSLKNVLREQNDPAAIEVFTPAVNSLNMRKALIGNKKVKNNLLILTDGIDKK